MPPASSPPPLPPPPPPPPPAQRGPNYFLLTPLVFAFLPLLYSHPALKSRPQLRTKLVAGAIGAGLLHGILLISGAGSTPSQEVERFAPPPKLMR
jgi:hypothetical protein